MGAVSQGVKPRSPLYRLIARILITGSEPTLRWTQKQKEACIPVCLHTIIGSDSNAPSDYCVNLFHSSL